MKKIIPVFLSFLFVVFVAGFFFYIKSNNYDFALAVAQAKEIFGLNNDFYEEDPKESLKNFLAESSENLSEYINAEGRVKNIIEKNYSMKVNFTAHPEINSDEEYKAELSVLEYIANTSKYSLFSKDIVIFCFLSSLYLNDPVILDIVKTKDSAVYFYKAEVKFNISKYSVMGAKKVLAFDVSPRLSKNSASLAITQAQLEHAKEEACESADQIKKSSDKIAKTKVEGLSEFDFKGLLVDDRIYLSISIGLNRKSKKWEILDKKLYRG